MIVILFGAPGVGKGTQAQILADNLGIAHLSTGDAFREAIRGKTEVGLLAKHYVDGGHLVPDDVTARVVEEAMANPTYSKGVILDGFPRTQNQAQALETMLAKSGKVIHMVINLDVENDIIVQRLLARGRADDTEEIINNRLSVYQQETAPLIKHFMDLGLLVHINGIGTITDVSDRILSAVISKG